MGSSNEMYERGVQDAAQDDLNPFYYEHYYYYRRGYDAARRRLRRTGSLDEPPPRRIPSILLILLVVVLGGVGLVMLPGRNTSSSETPEATSASRRLSASEAPVPTRTLATATPSLPDPSPVPSLYVGGAALIVNVGQSPLRARSEPGTGQPVQARFPENSEVLIVEGPVEADGYTWWRVEGNGSSGWSAERSPEGVVWLQPR